MGPLWHSELHRPGCPRPAVHQPQRPLHSSHEATEAQLSAWHAFRSPHEAVSQDRLPSELTLNSIVELPASVRSISKQLMPSSPCAWCDQSKDPSPSPSPRIRNVTDPWPSLWHQPCVQVSCEVPQVARAQSSSAQRMTATQSEAGQQERSKGTRCAMRRDCIVAWGGPQWHPEDGPHIFAIPAQPEILHHNHITRVSHQQLRIAFSHHVAGEQCRATSQAGCSTLHETA